MEEKPDFTKIFLGIIVGTILIGAIIYAGYLYSQKQGGKVSLPAGTYLGKPGVQQDTPPTAPLRFTSASDTPWVLYQGKIYPYSFSYPKTLNLAVFPNDPSESVAINWGNIPAPNNLLLNIEFVNDRNPEYVGKPEEFVRNWWKAFSGLKGVLSIDKFTNSNGLIGYKAIYVNNADQTPNVDVFFETPQDPNLMIRLANGVLDPTIFDRIVDSLNYSLTPTIIPTQ